MAKTIGQLTNINTRTQNDLKEVETNSTSYRSRRLYSESFNESALITMDNTNYDITAAGTPLTLQAAEGNALRVLIPTHLVMVLKYNTTVFDFDASGIDLVYSTATGTAIINIPQADINNGSTLRKVYPLPSAKVVVPDDELQLITGTAPTQGDSTVYFRLIFSLQDFNT